MYGCRPCANGAAERRLPASLHQRGKRLCDCVQAVMGCLTRIGYAMGMRLRCGWTVTRDPVMLCAQSCGR